MKKIISNAKEFLNKKETKDKVENVKNKTNQLAKSTFIKTKKVISEAKEKIKEEIEEAKTKAKSKKSNDNNEIDQKNDEKDNVKDNEKKENNDTSIEINKE